MYLSGRIPGLGQVNVMDFVRQGMRGAQPRFQVNGLMEKAEDLAIQEVDYRDDIVDIDHPDARTIAAAGEMRDLLAVIERIGFERAYRDGMEVDITRILHDIQGQA